MQREKGKPNVQCSFIITFKLEYNYYKGNKERDSDMTDIRRPGAVADYEDYHQFSDALVGYRNEVCDVLGIDEETLHMTGPKTVERKLAEAGATLIAFAERSEDNETQLVEA